MYKKRVGVLRGGPSDEYELSLENGAAVIAHLPKDRYDVVDIVIHSDGSWHLRGRPVAPERVFQNVDVIFNALRGAYGEDGTIQRYLAAHGVLYTGSLPLASALGMQKNVSQELFRAAGIQTPFSLVCRHAHNTPSMRKTIWASLPHPVMVKPAAGGSSIGITQAETEEEFSQAFTETLARHETALVEEYIVGREATCGIISNFRGQDIYALPPVEIVLSPEKKFFDYRAKYEGTAAFRCPGRFSWREKQELREAAKAAYTLLGARHYARFDFIVSPDRGIFILEANTLPDLRPSAPFVVSLVAIGSSLEEFLEHSIARATSVLIPAYK